MENQMELDERKKERQKIQDASTKKIKELEEWLKLSELKNKELKVDPDIRHVDFVDSELGAAKLGTDVFLEWERLKT